MRFGKVRVIVALITAAILLTGCNAVKHETESRTVHLTLKVPTLTHQTPADPDISSAAGFLEKMAAAYRKEHPNVTIKMPISQIVLIRRMLQISFMRAILIWPGMYIPDAWCLWMILFPIQSKRIFRIPCGQ